MVVHYPRTVWKNSYAEHKLTGKTYKVTGKKYKGKKKMSQDPCAVTGQGNSKESTCLSFGSVFPWGLGISLKFLIHYLNMIQSDLMLTKVNIRISPFYIFYELLCVQHSCSSTQSWGSVLPSIVETRDQNSRECPLLFSKRTLGSFMCIGDRNVF